jgi:hypothetical protein
MNRTAKIIFRVIGAIAILCAALGLYYSASSLATSFSGAFTAFESRHDTPYFYPAFYIMSAICIGCYALLIIFGVQFIRGRAFHVGWFTSLLTFEIVYFFSLAMLWLAPSIGMSVAAATGVANGGLMAQFLILFPLWAPPLAFWARRHVNESTNVA